MVPFDILNRLGVTGPCILLYSTPCPWTGILIANAALNYVARPCSECKLSTKRLVYTKWSRENCTKFDAPSFCNRLQ